jgi:hypothetical protein
MEEAVLEDHLQDDQDDAGGMLAHELAEHQIILLLEQMCVAGGAGEVIFLLVVCKRALGALRGVVHPSAILTATRCA